jgi:hypothetical protein
MGNASIPNTHLSSYVKEEHKKTFYFSLSELYDTDYRWGYGKEWPYAFYYFSGHSLINLVGF